MYVKNVCLSCVPLYYFLNVPQFPLWLPNNFWNPLNYPGCCVPESYHAHQTEVLPTMKREVEGQQKQHINPQGCILWVGYLFLTMAKRSICSMLFIHKGKGIQLTCVVQRLRVRFQIPCMSHRPLHGIPNSINWLCLTHTSHEHCFLTALGWLWYMKLLLHHILS